MVTMSSRGSFTSCWIWVATMLTMRLASRRARAVSTMIETPQQTAARREPGRSWKTRLLRRRIVPGPARQYLQRWPRTLGRLVLVVRAVHPSPGGQDLELHLAGHLPL